MSTRRVLRPPPKHVLGEVQEWTGGALSSKRRWAAWLLGSAVLCPIHEELLFRGFLLPSLALWLPPWAAVALSSLLFAAVHGDLVAVPCLWWAGSLFGWCYAITGNLLAPIMLHSILSLIAAAHARWSKTQQAVRASD